VKKDVSILLLVFSVAVSIIQLAPMFMVYPKNWEAYQLSYFSVVNYPGLEYFSGGRFWYKDYPLLYPVLHILQNGIFYILANYYVVILLCLLVNLGFYFIYFELLKVRKSAVNISLFLLMFGFFYRRTVLDYALFQRPFAGLLALVSYYYFGKKDLLKSSISISLAVLVKQYYVILLLCYFLITIMKKKDVMKFIVPALVILGTSTLVMEMWTHNYVNYMMFHNLKDKSFDSGVFSNPNFLVLCLIILPAFFYKMKINSLNLFLFIYLVWVSTTGKYIYPIVIFLLPFLQQLKWRKTAIYLFITILAVENMEHTMNVPYRIKEFSIQAKYNPRILDIIPLMEKEILSDVPALMKYGAEFMEEVIGDTEAIDEDIRFGNKPEDYLINTVREKEPDIAILSFLNMWDEQPLFKEFLISYFNYSLLVPFSSPYRREAVIVFTNSVDKFEIIKDLTIGEDIVSVGGIAFPGKYVNDMAELSGIKKYDFGLQFTRG